MLADALGAGRDPAAAPPRVAELAARSGVTRLSEIGVDGGSLDRVVAEILARPDLANTPDPPGEDELRGLLERAL